MKKKNKRLRTLILFIIPVFILMIMMLRDKKRKAKVITKRGKSIALSIEGEENLDILAGWCKVFHQSTDHFIIGRFTIPTKVSIAAFLSPFL